MLRRMSNENSKTIWRQQSKHLSISIASKPYVFVIVFYSFSQICFILSFRWHTTLFILCVFFSSIFLHSIESKFRTQPTHRMSHMVVIIISSIQLQPEPHYLKIYIIPWKSYLNRKMSGKRPVRRPLRMAERINSCCVAIFQLYACMHLPDQVTSKQNVGTTTQEPTNNCFVLHFILFYCFRLRIQFCQWTQIYPLYRSCSCSEWMRMANFIHANHVW